MTWVRKRDNVPGLKVEAKAKTGPDQEARVEQKNVDVTKSNGCPSQRRGVGWDRCRYGKRKGSQGAVEPRQCGWRA